MTSTVAHFVPAREAIRFSGELPNLAFHARVSLRTDLDPDLLGYCNGCELEGQEDARYRLSFAVGPRPTQWVDVCGGCLDGELRELLDRGRQGSMFARPARDIVLWCGTEHRPLPADLHDLAGLGLPCEHQGQRGFDCPALAEFTVAGTGDRALSCSAHLAECVRGVEQAERFSPPTVQSIPNAATERSAAA